MSAWYPSPDGAADCAAYPPRAQASICSQDARLLRGYRRRNMANAAGACSGIRGRASRPGAPSGYSQRPEERNSEMPANNRTRPTASAAPTSPPLLAPPLPVAPLVPPVHVVDLMTAAGSAVFGARWKGMEAKIVECPALSDAMPEFKTTYDIEPYAGESGFDDSDWPEIAATELGARRGGGMVSFFWYRTKLTIPANAAGFDTSGAMAVLRVNVDDYAEIWVNGVMPRAAGRTSP